MIVLSKREKRIWDCVYGTAYIHFAGDVIRAINEADEAIIRLRSARTEYRELPASLVIR